MIFLLLKKKKKILKKKLVNHKMSTRDSQMKAFGKLLDVMDEIREKCPWDKKQTFESLRHLTIEETYELGDAILDHDLTEIKKELGDLLLHIVFYAKIASGKISEKASGKKINQGRI